jgi:hypothetical protein
MSFHKMSLQLAKEILNNDPLLKSMINLIVKLSIREYPEGKFVEILWDTMRVPRVLINLCYEYTALKGCPWYDDHSHGGTSVSYMKEIVIIRREIMELESGKWTPLQRKMAITNSTHDDSWITIFHGDTYACKNCLYLSMTGGEVRLSRCSTGRDLTSSAAHALQTEGIYYQYTGSGTEREVNVYLKLEDI